MCLHPPSALSQKLSKFYKELSAGAGRPLPLMIKKRAAVYPVHVDSGTGDVWPRVNHWLTHFDRPHLAEAAWATCQEQAIIPYSDLPALRRPSVRPL